MYTILLLLSLSFLLITPFYLIYKPPGILITYFSHRWPDVLFHVPTDEKIVALTIDDSPSEYTREILSVLQEHDAKATFFVIGSQGKELEGIEVLKELVRAGNELGNHAMRDEPSRGLSDQALSAEIRAVHTVISRVYEDERPEKEIPKYFRPGSGFFSERMRENVGRLGWKLVLGGNYPHDAQISWPRVNARHILSMLRPGGIIICHDRRAWTAPMLMIVLPELKKRGYEAVTVTELKKRAAREWT